MIENHFKLFKKNSAFRDELLFTFLFKELAFLFLPLLILFPISISIGKISIIDFFASSNFSFVVVVIMAITLSHFIELKTQIQKSINYKLFEGLKFQIILLIASSNFSLRAVSLKFPNSSGSINTLLIRIAWCLKWSNAIIVR